MSAPQSRKATILGDYIANCVTGLRYEVPALHHRPARAIAQVNDIIEDMSDIAVNVAATVEQQNAAVTVIAGGVNKASSEAREGAQAMSRVAAATLEAHSTAADVKALADVLAAEAEGLDSQVRHFLIQVQTA